jgi:hypothetical protein
VGTGTDIDFPRESRSKVPEKGKEMWRLEERESLE